MQTYQSLYQNEIRGIELTINDQDGQDFAPSAAFAAVETETGTEVVAEQAAQIVGNTILTVIGTLVTANPGKYRIIWRIHKSGYTYYHATDLDVFAI